MSQPEGDEDGGVPILEPLNVWPCQDFDDRAISRFDGPLF